MSTRNRSLVGAAALGMGITVAGINAGPLDPSHVPEGATWTVHVDLESLLESSLGEMVMAEAQGDLEIEELDQFGIDPFSDLFGFTAYGTGEDERSIVAIVEGSDSLENIIAALEEEAGDAYSRIRSGGRTVHAIEDGDQSIFAVFEDGAGGRTRVILSTNLDNIDASVAQLGQRNGASFLDGKEPRAGAFIYVCAAEIPHAGEGHPASNLLKDAGGMMLEIGEHRGGMFIDASLETGNAENANMLMQAVRGVQAMAGMMAGGDPELQQYVGVINNLNLNVRDDVVSASLQIEMDTIHALMEQAAEHGHELHGGEDHHHGDEHDHEDGGDDRLRDLEEQIQRLERLLRRLDDDG